MASRLEKFTDKKSKTIKNKKKTENIVKTDIKEKRLPIIYPIVYDHRENNGNILKWLPIIAKEFKMEITYSNAQLEEGDYTVTFDWEAELKDETILKVRTYIKVEVKANDTDLSESIYKGRLQKQFENLINFEKKCLESMTDEERAKYDEIEIYCGASFIIDKQKIRQDNPSLWKAITTWEAKFDKAHIPLNISYNEEEFVRYFLKLLYYDFRKTQKHYVISDFPKHFEVFMRQLIGIPDIGHKIAYAIAEYCSNGYEDLIAMSIEDIMKITAPQSTTPSQIKKNRKTAEKIYYYIRNKPVPQDQENTLIDSTDLEFEL